MFGLNKAQMNHIESNTVVTRASTLGAPREYHSTEFDIQVEEKIYPGHYVESRLSVDGKIDTAVAFRNLLDRYCEIYKQKLTTINEGN